MEQKHYRDMDTVRENIRITQESIDQNREKLGIKARHLIKATKELLKFIEINDINDQALGNYDRDTWRSEEFQQLINEVKKNL